MDNPEWPEGLAWEGLASTRVSLGYNKHRQRVVLLERGERKIHEVITGSNLLDPQRAVLFDRLHARLVEARSHLAVETAVTYFAAGMQDMYATERMRREYENLEVKRGE